LHDPQGKHVVTQRYELKPRASLFFGLNAGALLSEPLAAQPKQRLRQHGMLAVTNDAGTAKSFGYLLIQQPERGRFSVEHPIHQGLFKPRPAAPPFDAKEQFKAKNVLYSPLLFKSKRIGGLTYDTRCYLGTGLPLEESQWFYPFAVDGAGEAVWSSMNDEKFARAFPSQSERGVLRLAAGQSCVLDFKGLALPQGFSGGLAVAVAPDTSHTLLKLEVRVPEWGAFAFTHFRPGLRSARGYQKPAQRGGLATDYIVSGARLARRGQQLEFDELLGVLNIDDQGVEAKPTLELFGANGLVKRVALGALPPFACRHYLLSQLLANEFGETTLTLRLTDARATLLLSAVHLDHARRDLALDHGSDRFSTFLDYGCI
jgi:hypothetical protein